MEKNVLTTGDIAKYCNVHFRTVVRWVERGLLKSHKLPGRGDNRIQVKDFLQFLNENNFPIPEEFASYNKKILVVDDDEDIVKLIRLKLKKKGFEVKSASDGFRAGAMLYTFSPSVMTLDLQMPGLSGLEVIKAIRELKEIAHQKILVISAASKSAIEEAMNLGADDYLKKPFNPDELVEKVLQLIPPTTLAFY